MRRHVLLSLAGCCLVIPVNPMVAAEVGGSSAGAASQTPPEAAGSQRPADDDIARSVDARVRVVAHVEPGRIRVTVTDGIAALAGEVPTLFQATAARAAAEEIRGVLGVVSFIHVVPPARVTDAQIASMIAMALEDDDAVHPFAGGIEPVVSGGRVRLIGTAPTWGVRALADRLAADVRGVIAVDDRLVVTSRAMTDPQLGSLAQALLHDDARLQGDRLDARAVHQRVVLAGWVTAFSHVGIAMDLCRRAGASDVDADGVSVHWWAAGPDERARRPLTTPDALVDATRRAFAIDPRLDPDALTVLADEAGVVRVIGVVPTLAAVDAVRSDTSGIVGVTAIDLDGVVVKPTADDATAARRLDAALLRDAVVAGQVKARVRDGRATLTGVVDEGLARQRAHDIAETISGVTAIDDDIRSREPQR